MKRIVFQSLIEWMNKPGRRPLVLRGARQVGKTHLVRELGKEFDSYVEANFEQSPQLKNLFITDLDPSRIREMLELQLNQSIIPGKTLLFLDEIQECPQAILALRYFYEEMPELHIIAAGSLLDFAIEKIGIPVGRVSFLYLYPLSFIEFLVAAGKERLAQKILQNPADQPVPDSIHQQLLVLLGEYMLTGGMPEVVLNWVSARNFSVVQQIQQDLIEAYRQDFTKYAKRHQLKYVDLIFNTVPRLICQLFKYSHLQTPYQKRELAPCLELLIKANIVHKVQSTRGDGVPLGATIDFEKFKLIFLDIGLCETILGLPLKDWLLDPLNTLINKGELCEAFVGQELLAYAASNVKSELYFWQRDARGSQAEIDYLVNNITNLILPVEVKSGKGGALKSLHYFLTQHPATSYGVRFSTQNYSVYDGIYSYPLYAVAKLFDNNPLLKAFCNISGL